MSIEQRIFDEVAAHLLTQNKQSFGQFYGEPMCMYKVDGLRCAVGCLIDDEDYSQDMEGNPISFGLTMKAVKKHLGVDKITEDELNLLRILQQVHDDWMPEGWRERLLVIGNRYNLNTDILDNVEK